MAEEGGGDVLQKATPAGPTAEERRRFFEEFTAQVKTARGDAQAWAEQEAERAALAGTLLDGLGVSAETAPGSRHISSDVPGYLRVEGRPSDR